MYQFYHPKNMYSNYKNKLCTGWKYPIHNKYDLEVLFTDQDTYLPTAATLGTERAGGFTTTGFTTLGSSGFCDSLLLTPDAFDTSLGTGIFPYKQDSVNNN